MFNYTVFGIFFRFIMLYFNFRHYTLLFIFRTITYISEGVNIYFFIDFFSAAYIFKP